MPTADAAIITEGLTKRYGGLTAVDGLDLALHRGEVFGLLGPNGAGKTTTILMLLGLTEPSAGKARVEGYDPVREPLQVKRLVGYLPDNVGFYPDMTGRQNLRYTASLNRRRGREAEERIAGLLEQVGLSEAADRPAGTYSRGMRQRLGIADALVKDPCILVLDEPTIGIDPEGIRELLALIRALSRERGITILLSSHLLHQVQEVCDRVGIFVSGRLIAVGPVEDLARQLAENTACQIEVQAVDSEGIPQPETGRQALATVTGVLEVKDERGMWLMRADHDVREAAARALAKSGLVPVHLRLRTASLDDIYGRYFHEEVKTRDV
ncbi:MAG: ABC transporter ATP-binding protein [Thermoleophilia bacterium]|nr:ABC transporter ATP-binding protein [Thermoleophilia bacterium]